MKHRFKNLKVWQLSIDLVEEIYSITKVFPDDEKFGLTSQIRRSCVSIPSNIAEGSGRGSDKELSVFLGYALGSAFELETQLIVAKRLKLISEEKGESLTSKTEEIQRVIIGLKEKIKLSKV